MGYGVRRPQFRRRGFATVMLRQAFVVARDVGVADVLITCHVDNVASVKVIERCGGIFEGIVTEGANSAANGATGSGRRRRRQDLPRPGR